MKKGLRDDEVGVSEALPLIPERPHEFPHNSGAPTVVSRSRTTTLTADCAMCSSLAAALKLTSRATETKICNYGFVTCGNAAFVVGREFSQLLLLPLF
ncbi:hypothetical protein QFZ33_000760 [Arthrobacter globiformis]|nr:hypothetical protein [Arthrobacter globiformis]